MEDIILITEINDFVFCPISIYFHHLYGNMEKVLYQSTDQLNGSKAHEAIDLAKYSSKVDVLQGIDVYSEKYRLLGKIDIYDRKSKVLRERKRQIKTVFDGYIFQLYAQYFAMTEMGYDIKRIELYSMMDNKTYEVKLPKEDLTMFNKFEDVIDSMRHFQMDNQFEQKNKLKCARCIYEPACDRGEEK